MPARTARSLDRPFIADAARPQGATVRILGLDPGLRHTGWGVIDAEGNRLRFVASGAVEPGVHGSMAERLHRLFAEVRSVIERFKPRECAIEDTFVNKNPQSTLKLGHARAAAMLAPAECALAVFEYKPNLVKKSVVGAGHADKGQVSAMVRMLMPGSDAATADAADALAVAICHAHHRASALRLAAAR